MTATIEATGLTKRFGAFTAVDGVSFSVRRGEVVGFLGPNGAGKSTTIEMLCTIRNPTSGTARVAGFDVVRQRTEVRRRIGLVFQQQTLDQQLTAEQNLRFHADLYGLSRADADRLSRAAGQGGQAGAGSPSCRATNASSVRIWRTRSSTTSELCPAS